MYSIKAVDIELAKFTNANSALQLCFIVVKRLLHVFEQLVLLFIYKFYLSLFLDLRLAKTDQR